MVTQAQTFKTAAGSLANEPLLRVDDLKAYFFMDEGTVKAVDGVSFDVQPGKVVGIVGESGCGKSVTMKAILQILEPGAKIVNGKVTLRSRVHHGDLNSPEELVELTKLGRNSRAMRRIRGAEIALIPQEPMAAFSPVHTVGNQIMETILLHQDVSKKEARQIAIDVFPCRRYLHARAAHRLVFLGAFRRLASAGHHCHGA